MENLMSSAYILAIIAVVTTILVAIGGATLEKEYVNNNNSKIVIKQIKNKGNISHINKRHKTTMTGRKGFETNNKVLEINSNRINDKATIDDNIKRMVFISRIKGSKSSFKS